MVVKLVVTFRDFPDFAQAARELWEAWPRVPSWPIAFQHGPGPGGRGWPPAASPPLALARLLSGMAGEPASRSDTWPTAQVGEVRVGFCPRFPP